VVFNRYILRAVNNAKEAATAATTDQPIVDIQGRHLVYPHFTLMRKALDVCENGYILKNERERNQCPENADHVLASLTEIQDFGNARTCCFEVRSGHVFRFYP
jgi:hypothetical protein